jgi:BNR repeat-like domain
MANIPETKPLPESNKPLWAIDAPDREYDWSEAAANHKPFFEGPVRFVHFPENQNSIPMYQHNHCPSITWCDNGDLMAVWFSTKSEAGREMTILASRLRAGKDVWDAPYEFFKAPDRNMTGSTLYNDGQGTLYHLNGLESDGTWGKLAATHRISQDNGVTWSHPRLISPEHRHRNQIIHGLSQTKEGYFLQPCDAVHGGSGGTAILISKDKGVTWNDPGIGKPEPEFEEGKTGAWIAGIHAGVVQLLNGDLMALGRSNNINDRMPMSISKNMGQLWKYSASPFPPISSGQRLVLTRLRGGQLFFASFTDSSDNLKNPEGIIIKNSNGEKQRVYGLFAALSYDDGKTWPVKRLITNPQIDSLDGGAWTGAFTMDATHAEPKGYLAMTQTPDGVIHLISSALHYRFNLAWLEAF